MSFWQRVWHHLRRGPFQSLAAILATFSVFLLATSFLFLLLTLLGAVRYFESRPELSAFLKDDVNQQRVEELVKELRQTPGVKDVHYVSKEEALQIYRRLNKDNPLLLEMVTADVLPASIEVSANSPNSLQLVADKLQKNKDLFEDIYFPKQVIAFLSHLVTTLEWLGGGLLIFLGFYALITIMVVVGMKIALFSEEIEILRLLGASGRYIAGPFLLEGVIYNLFGFFLGSGGLVAVLALTRRQLITVFQQLSLPLPDWRWLAASLLLEFLFAIFVGFLASLLAVRRYLK